MPDDEATRTLLDNVDGKTINEPRVIKFRTGRRLKQWNRNCVALGLSSGFLEPLESTSIHLIQNGIIRLIKLFPFREIDQAAVDQYNEDVKTEIEFIRDFIILHYHLTHLIAQHPYDLFADQSWAAVMLGQGLVPGGYHPVVEMAGDDELRQFLARIRASVRQIVDLQPMHREFVAGYCSAPPSD
jgi:tryptophan halogenase